MIATRITPFLVLALLACGTTAIADDAVAVPLPAGTEFVAAAEPEGTHKPTTVLEGTIREIRPPAKPAPQGAGLDEWARVTIEGSSPGSFLVLLPPQVTFPLLVDDHVRASFTCASRPPSTLCTATVSAADGTLLLFATENGAPPPDGWAVTRGPKCGPRTGNEVSFCTNIDHMGRHASIPPGKWRRLATGDGRWLVSGNATDRTGSSPPVPDWSPTSSYSLVRVR